MSVLVDFVFYANLADFECPQVPARHGAFWVVWQPHYCSPIEAGMTIHSATLRLEYLTKLGVILQWLRDRTVPER